ncbi:WD40-repeat-containing domain protein [Dunaliella salina]|uniref:WD40-repeat-containing domain protein n=1 Tax=Dunaliella salina TaxID=3046 RepID=A0ABQ7G6Q5_DUNSA|nr:WD40-repeat-containing domain protein [Dunaliella salina]|eukprot:KAF5830281.1 WD40-repeat-containing domain protein [Dunaliella salina]
MLKVVEVQVRHAERQAVCGEASAAAVARGQNAHQLRSQQGVQDCRSAGPSAEVVGDLMETDGPQADEQMERAPDEVQHHASPPSRTRRRYRTFCFTHPTGGDGIDRARHMPQHPHLVATKISDQGLYLFDISPALGGACVQGQGSGREARHGWPGLQELRQGRGQPGGTQSQHVHEHHQQHPNHHHLQQQQQHKRLYAGGHGTNITGGSGGGRGVQGNGEVCNGTANCTGCGGDRGVQGSGTASLAGADFSLEGDSDTECMCGGPLGSLGPQHGRGSSKRKSSSSSANPAPSGFGLCWSPTEPGWLLSTCTNGAIQHVRLDTTAVASAAASASRPDGLPVLGAYSFQRNAHAGGVNDVAFPAAEDGTSSSVWSGRVYASVGEDGFLKVWDDRKPGTAVCVPAHRGYAANSVACSTGHIIATGGGDGKLKLFDLRAVASRLTQDAAVAATLYGEGQGGPSDSGGGCNNGGGVSPTIPGTNPGGNANASTSNNHSSGSSSGGGQDVLPFRVFGSHKCPVNQVSWSPDWPNLLASSDEDNRVFVWDVARAQPTPMDITSPPQLRFIHTGHASSVYDISWTSSSRGSATPFRPAATPFLASVSPVLFNEAEDDDEDGEDKEREPLQWHVLHTFSPAADILHLDSPEHLHSTTHNR